MVNLVYLVGKKYFHPTSTFIGNVCQTLFYHVPRSRKISNTKARNCELGRLRNFVLLKYDANKMSYVYDI